VHDDKYLFQQLQIMVKEVDARMEIKIIQYDLRIFLLNKKVLLQDVCRMLRKVFLDKYPLMMIQVMQK